MEKLERIQRQVTKMTKEWESELSEEMVEELGVFGLEGKRERSHVLAVLRCLRSCHKKEEGQLISLGTEDRA